MALLVNMILKNGCKKIFFDLSVKKIAQKKILSLK